ncbi:hypothetical protein FBU59_006737 [Linderina macrospora]|uniref:Uncharacterized protein n=1 Tax=Linderina macrospora TaxID=4868 RepID=A0ACC1IZ28_9FUNG|nr:hypothetical protein FBU59_006737 [Linderina macrospora]
MRVYISINAQYRVVELGHDEEGANIKAYPIKFTEQPTLPQIFTKRRHARCCDEITRAMKSSQLQELINGERVQV